MVAIVVAAQRVAWRSLGGAEQAVQYRDTQEHHPVVQKLLIEAEHFHVERCRGLAQCDEDEPRDAESVSFVHR